MAGAGFMYRHSASLGMFLDRPNAKARDAVHLVFAGEKVRPDSLFPAPDVADCEPTEYFRLITVEALIN